MLPLQSEAVPPIPDPDAYVVLGQGCDESLVLCAMNVTNVPDALRFTCHCCRAVTMLAVPTPEAVRIKREAAIQAASDALEDLNVKAIARKVGACMTACSTHDWDQLASAWDLRLGWGQVCWFGT